MSIHVLLEALRWLLTGAGLGMVLVIRRLRKDAGL